MVSAAASKLKAQEIGTNLLGGFIPLISSDSDLLL